jgi:hypothetical protein
MNFRLISASGEQVPKSSIARGPARLLSTVFVSVVRGLCFQHREPDLAIYGSMTDASSGDE